MRLPNKSSRSLSQLQPQARPMATHHSWGQASMCMLASPGQQLGNH